MNDSWWHQDDRVLFIEDHAVVIEHAAATGRTASDVAQNVDAHFTAKLTKINGAAQFVSCFHCDAPIERTHELGSWTLRIARERTKALRELVS